jgi:nucleoid DNA-binding protein
MGQLPRGRLGRNPRIGDDVQVSDKGYSYFRAGQRSAAGGLSIAGQ